MCVENLRERVLSRRRRAKGPNEGEGAGNVDGDDGRSGSEKGKGPDGRPAGGGSRHGGGADFGPGTAAGGPASGGAHAAANAPPLLTPVEQPPAGVMAVVFDAWGETRNVAEHEQLRADLTAHV